MPQRIRSHIIERRSNRLKLVAAPTPIYAAIAPSINLGYRRCKGAGRWIVRVYDGKGKPWQRAFADADDYEAANGETVLDYPAAVEKARLLARGQDTDAGRPVTLATALADYEKDLLARGGEIGNVLRAKYHLTPLLLSRPVAFLRSRELRQWRDGLVAAGMKAATINRTITPIKAALNAAAAQDEKIGNQTSWKIGLANIRNAATPRNVILSDEQVRDVIAAAYVESMPFGLLTETAAVTGSRPSQLRRLTVADLQDGRADARLMVPRSGKGRAGNPKRNEKTPVPITSGLAANLRQAAVGRAPHEPLLVKVDGTPWRGSPNDTRHPFARVLGRVGGIDARATFYSLRHSQIARALLNGAPVRLVAANADTSAVMVERVYSAFISDHADTLLRRGLLDTETPGAASIISIAR